jgi:hypothetical protein
MKAGDHVIIKNKFCKTELVCKITGVIKEFNDQSRVYFNIKPYNRNIEFNMYLDTSTKYNIDYYKHVVDLMLKIGK